MKKNEVFVVMPAYNEERRIGQVLTGLRKEKLKVIVVDDGSRDTTSRVAKRFTPYVLRHPINLGKGAALKTGCDAASSLGAKAVVLMDSDGQHKVSDLPKFIKALKDCEVVFGVRNFRGTPTVRLIGNKIVTFLVRSLFGISVKDILCGFKAFTKNAYKKIRWDSLGYSVETEIVALTGKNRLKYCEVPVATVYYDKFKGLTVTSGFEIILEILWLKLK